MDLLANAYHRVSPTRNHFNWVPIILWIEAFVTVVFLVNLMIARMTSTYERIHSESVQYRAHQRCEFIIEFKDLRGAPPPINLLFLWKVCIPQRRLAKWIRRADLQHSCICMGQSRLASIARCVMPLFREDRAHGFRVPMGRDTTQRLQSHERQYARLFREQRMHDQAMQMEARVAAANDELLPAMRTAVDHVDDKVERVDDKVERIDDKVDKMAAAVSAMAEELVQIHKLLQAPAPAASDTPPAASRNPPAASITPLSAWKAPPAALDTPPSAWKAPPAALDTPPAASNKPPAASDTPPAASKAPPAASDTAGESLKLPPSASFRKRRTAQMKSRLAPVVEVSAPECHASSTSPRRSLVSQVGGVAASAITSMTSVLDPRMSSHVTDLLDHRDEA